MNQGGTVSSMEQHTGSMLMTWQEKKQRHTHKETVPRHALQTAVNRSMCTQYTHAHVSTERWGPWMETLLNCKSPPTSQPRVWDWNCEVTQDTFVQAHKLFLLWDYSRVTLRKSNFSKIPIIFLFPLSLKVFHSWIWTPNCEKKKWN